MSHRPDLFKEPLWEALPVAESSFCILFLLYHHQHHPRSQLTIFDLIFIAMTDQLTSLPYRRISRGKVRDLYEINNERLLIVSSDRISAFDVNMRNVRLNLCGILGTRIAMLTI